MRKTSTDPKRLLRRALATAAVAAWLLSAPFAAAQWVSLGPEGGEVTALATSPSQPGLVYAGLTYGGVFRSSDGGRSWRPARGGLQTLVWDLAIDPADPETVYAGSGRGLWKSIDGAETWRRVRGGLPDGLLEALAVHPTRAGTVFAGIWRTGLFKSEDGGASWRQIGRGRGLGSARVPAVPLDLAFDPDEPETIYAAVEHARSGVYESTDGGTTWSHMGGS